MDDRAEYRGILRQVLEAPAEDWPRQVLADWLEDDGQAERAELIRAQLALAKLPGGCELTSTHADCIFCAGGGPELLLRQHVLKQKLQWRREFAAAFGIAVAEYDTPGVPTAGDVAYVGMTRGLASHVFMKAEHFTPEAALWLFSNHPITSVHLRDKFPYHGPGSDVYVWTSYIHAWSVEPSSYVRKGILDRMDGRIVRLFNIGGMPIVHYDSAESALQALNDGCVAYGRRLAGLPDLYRGK